MELPITSIEKHNKIFIRHQSLYYSIKQLMAIYGLPEEYLTQYVKNKTTGGLYIKLNDKLASINISKCACTYLKHIAYHELTGKWTKDKHPLDVLYPMPNRLVHVGSGLRFNDEFNNKFKNEKNNEELSNCVKFAVYRDPIKRIISAYVNKNLQEDWVQYRMRGLTRESSFEDFMKFVRIELAKQDIRGIDPCYIEEHIRPQSLYYDENEADFVVKLEDLDDFLKSNGITELPERANKSDYTSIDKEQFIPYYDEIKELYKDDYEILNRYNVWKKEV